MIWPAGVDAVDTGDLLTQIKGGTVLTPVGNRVLIPIVASQQMIADQALRAKLARLRAAISIEEDIIDNDE